MFVKQENTRYELSHRMTNEEANEFIEELEEKYGINGVPQQDDINEVRQEIPDWFCAEIYYRAHEQGTSISEYVAKSNYFRR